MNRPRFATYACNASFIVLGISGTLLGPTFQSLTKQFNVPLENAGIFTALQFIGVTITVVIAGRLLDRINARWILAGGMVLMCGGLILLGIAPALHALPLTLFGALLLGIGYGMLDVGPNLVIVTLNPDRASAALNMLNVYYGIGAVVGPQIVNIALQQNNFALAYGITAGLCLLLVIPLGMVSLRIQSGGVSGTAHPSIRWITLLPFAVLLFSYVGSEVGFGSWIFTQITKVALAAEATGTLGASIFWGGVTIGRIAASYILRRLVDDVWLAISILVIGLGTAFLLIVPHSAPVALVSAFVVGFGCGPVFPTALGMINNRYPEARGTVSGILMALGTIGASVVPWVQGQVGGGNNGGMIVPLAAALVMFGMIMLIQRGQPAQSAQATL